MSAKVTPPAEISGPYTFAVGKRKTAIARVKLITSGTGKISINERDAKIYFPVAEHRANVTTPFKISGVNPKVYDLLIKVAGGGVVSQAEACRHGISRALVKENPALRAIIKPEGLLTRDSRIKERKKPGLKRARRAPQWAKR